MPPSPTANQDQASTFDRAKVMTRRTAIGALGAMAAAYALVPRMPRAKRDMPANARNRVQLSYWEKWTASEGAAIQEIVDLFNQSQDRIWVHRVPVADITSKAMVAIGGGDPPDLVGLFSYNVSNYAQAGAIMPLDDPQFPVDELGGIDLSAYAPAVRELLSYNGRQYAGVNTCYTLAMYYNKSHYREVGWDPEKPPTSVAELDALAEELTLYNEGKDTIKRAGFSQLIPDWWPYFWPVMFGGRLYDFDTNRALLDSDECVRTYEWVQSCAKRYGPDRARAFAKRFDRSKHTAQDPFITGQCSMLVQGPWLANFINQFNPDLDYGAFSVPVAEPTIGDGHPIGMLEADVLFIPKGCPHPREAYEFFKFTQRQDIQERLALLHFKPSPMATVSANFLARHPNRAIRSHNAIATSPSVSILPQTRIWEQFSDMMTTAFGGIWQGNDPRKELMQVQNRLQQVLDLTAERNAIRQARKGNA